MPRTRYLAALACALFAVFAFSAVAGATITARTIDYGPWTIPAGGGDPHDHETMGMIENDIDFNVTKPCTGCDIIAIDPELVYVGRQRSQPQHGSDAPPLRVRRDRQRQEGPDLRNERTGGCSASASSRAATSARRSTSRASNTATTSRPAASSGTWSPSS